MEIIRPYLEKFFPNKNKPATKAEIKPVAREPKEPISSPKQENRLEVRTTNDLQQSLEAILSYAKVNKDLVLEKKVAEILQTLEKRKQPSPEREKTEEEQLQELITFVNSEAIIGDERSWLAKIREKLPDLKYTGADLSVKQNYNLDPIKTERGQQLAEKLSNGPFMIFTLGNKHYMFPNVNYYQRISPVYRGFDQEGKTSGEPIWSIDAKLAEVKQPAILEPEGRNWAIIRKGTYKLHPDNFRQI